MNLITLREALCEELSGYTKVNNMGDLEAVHKLTDTIKNIDKIMKLNEDSYGRRDSYGLHYVRGHYSNNDALSKKIDEMLGNPRLTAEDRQALEHAASLM